MARVSFFGHHRIGNRRTFCLGHSPRRRCPGTASLSEVSGHADSPLSWRLVALPAHLGSCVHSGRLIADLGRRCVHLRACVECKKVLGGSPTAPVCRGKWSSKGPLSTSIIIPGRASCLAGPFLDTDSGHWAASGTAFIYNKMLERNSICLGRCTIIYYYYYY